MCDPLTWTGVSKLLTGAGALFSGMSGGGGGGGGGGQRALTEQELENIESQTGLTKQQIIQMQALLPFQQALAGTQVSQLQTPFDVGLMEKAFPAMTGLESMRESWGREVGRGRERVLAGMEGLQDVSPMAAQRMAGRYETGATQQWGDIMSQLMQQRQQTGMEGMLAAMLAGRPVGETASTAPIPGITPQAGVGAGFAPEVTPPSMPGVSPYKSPLMERQQQAPPASFVAAGQGLWGPLTEMERTLAMSQGLSPDRAMAKFGYQALPSGVRMQDGKYIYAGGAQAGKEWGGMSGLNLNNLPGGMGGPGSYYFGGPQAGTKYYERTPELAQAINDWERKQQRNF